MVICVGIFFGSRDNIEKLNREYESRMNDPRYCHTLFVTGFGGVKYGGSTEFIVPEAKDEEWFYSWLDEVNDQQAFNEHIAKIKRAVRECDKLLYCCGYSRSHFNELEQEKNDCPLQFFASHSEEKLTKPYMELMMMHFLASLALDVFQIDIRYL